MDAKEAMEKQTKITIRVSAALTLIFFTLMVFYSVLYDAVKAIFKFTPGLYLVIIVGIVAAIIIARGLFVIKQCADNLSKSTSKKKKNVAEKYGEYTNKWKAGFEKYKVLVEEHRFLTELSWKIFGIGATLLFTAPFLLAKQGLFGKSLINLAIGGIGLWITVCIAFILFNYSRRENILENHIVALEDEDKLNIEGLSVIRDQVIEQPYFKWLILSAKTKIFNKNRTFMALIFLSLIIFYLAIIWFSIF